MSYREARQIDGITRLRQNKFLISGLALIIVLLGAMQITSSANAATKYNRAATVGVGTPAALHSKYCSAKTGRVAIPWPWSPPCVAPLKKGTKNGGATSKGVTAKSIKVVYYDSATGPTTCYMYFCQAKDATTLFSHFYQTWGRKINLVDFVPTGNTETEQRADAIRIAAMKPFAVMCEFCGQTLIGALARDHILTSSYQQTESFSSGNQPYIWGLGVDPSSEVYQVAEFAAAALANRPAQWAGDTTMQTQTRKFGVLLPSTQPPSLFSSTFSKYDTRGGPAPTILPYNYSSGYGISGNAAEYQQIAPVLVSQLKAAGDNNVVLFTDPTLTTYILTQAASQNYFPEWTITGFEYQDVDVFAESFNQAEWAHAFGLGQTEPRETATFGPTPYLLYQWYYGNAVHRNNDATNTNMQGNIGRNGVPLEQMSEFFIGIQLAGPDLTPQTYQQGMFAFPPSGGSASKEIGWPQLSFGSHGYFPWKDYGGWDDYAEIWYNPTAVGESNSGVDLTGTGKYEYIANGKRYVPGSYPTTLPPEFQASGAVDLFSGVPASDKQPNFTCAGCPSSNHPGNPNVPALD